MTGEEPVTILQALGTDDERIVDTTWARLDQTLDADHLTSVWIPSLAAPAGAEYIRLHQLTRTLREQCPWDIEQTHASLVPYLIEETYEVVDALQSLDSNDQSTDDDLVEELGDLLYQIELHATIAEQEGRFTVTDVVRGIYNKLIRRHPHVFSPENESRLPVKSIDEVLHDWTVVKKTEKQRTSAVDGIPRSMPALSYAAKVGLRASQVGFDWPTVDGVLQKIVEETAELAEAIDGMMAAQTAGCRDTDKTDLILATSTASEVGDLLFATVNIARHLRIDPEFALRAATDKFQRRFKGVESIAAERGIDLRFVDLPMLDSLWDEAKRAEN